VSEPSGPLRQLGVQSCGAGSVDVQLVVVEKEDAFGRDAELADGELEDLPVGLHRAELVRGGVVIERGRDSHLVEKARPVELVAVAQARDLEAAAKRSDELEDTGEGAARPAREAS